MSNEICNRFFVISLVGKTGAEFREKISWKHMVNSLTPFEEFVSLFAYAYQHEDGSSHVLND